MDLLKQSPGENHRTDGSDIAKGLIDKLTADKQRRMDGALNRAQQKLMIEKELLAFYGELFDQNPDLWRKITHNKISDEGIITEKIPLLLKRLFENSHPFGAYVYNFKDIDSSNKYPEVQLGWYQFSDFREIFETVIEPGRFFFSKNKIKQVSKHFIPMSHGLTDKGNEILERHSKIKAGVTVINNEGGFIDDILLEND